MSSGMGSMIGITGIIVTSIYLSREVPKWQYAKKNNNDKLIFEYTIKITKITYPTNLPSEQTIMNNDGFIECQCGDGCTSKLGICTKLYTIDSLGNDIMIKENLESDNECTFREYDCTTDVQERTYSILNNMIEIQDYIRIMNNNQTINIYKKNINNNEVYFMHKLIKNETYHKNVVITCSVFLVISVFIFQISSQNNDDDK